MTADPRFDGPGPDEIWRAALLEGRFLIQRCKPCAGAEIALAHANGGVLSSQATAILGTAATV